MTINLEGKEVVMLYGILETVLKRHDRIKDQLHNPELAKATVESIMEKIVIELEKLETNE